MRLSQRDYHVSWYYLLGKILMILFSSTYRKKSNWKQMQLTLLENTDITYMWVKVDPCKPQNHHKWGFWPLMLLLHIRKKKKKLCLTMRNILMRLEMILYWYCNDKKKWTRIMWDPLNQYIFTNINTVSTHEGTINCTLSCNVKIVSHDL